MAEAPRERTQAGPEPHQAACGGWGKKKLRSLVASPDVSVRGGSFSGPRKDRVFLGLRLGWGKLL